MPEDKRDECGCRDKPCQWPDCLTDEEADELAQAILKDVS